MRLSIFLQPLGGALKNRSAAPASPPCFRRRRTGCGTQHPLRLACVSLAAAPTTPRCFRRWRRSSSLQSAPLLFESTRPCEADICAKENRQCILHQRFFHGRGWITQAAHLKRPRRGLFAAGTYSGGRCCSNPPLRRFTNFQIKQKLQCHYNTGVLGGRGWIRTTEAEKQQIYSLSPLATREHAQILFTSVAGRLVYFIRLRAICQLLFSDFCSFSAEAVGRVSFWSDVSGARNPARRQWLRRTWGRGQ